MTMSTRPFVKNCPDFLPEHEQCDVMRWTGGPPKDYAGAEDIVERFAAHIKDFPEPAIGPDTYGGVEITNDQETTFKFHAPYDPNIFQSFMENLEHLISDNFVRREILHGIFCTISYYFTLRLVKNSSLPTTIYMTIYWEFANEQ